MMKNKLFLLICVFFSLVINGSAFATTYYSSPSGSGSVCSLSSPCTLNTGLGKLVAGDTLYLRGGTYTLTSAISFSTNGTASNRITIAGYSGETPIISGNNTVPSTATTPLIKIGGDYVTLRDVNVINSFGGGVFLTGDYDYGININLKHIGQTGIGIFGTANVLDGCTCTDNGWRYWSAYSVGSWGSAICAGSGSVNGTIRNCIAYANGGEGINSYSGATGTIIEDNIAYDNKSVNYYADSTTNVTYRRNIGYHTGNAPHGGGYPYNFYVGAETRQPNNLEIINNFLLGGSPNLVIGSNVTGNPVITIAHNTFVNAVDTGGGWNMGVYLKPTSYGVGSVFKNNLIIQENAGTVCAVVPSTHTNLTFSYNAWSKTPDSDASGTGDIICSGGDCKLAKTGSVTPGGLTANYFKILEASPARDKGRAIADITTDHFGTTRVVGPYPDMGGHEYGAGGTELNPPRAPQALTILN